MKKLEIVLHDARKELPKTADDYFVVCGNGYITNRLDCTNGRWNCHYDLNGELDTEHEITDVIYWAKSITLEDIERSEDYD